MSNILFLHCNKHNCIKDDCEYKKYIFFLGPTGPSGGPTGATGRLYKSSKE